MRDWSCRRLGRPHAKSAAEDSGRILGRITRGAAITITLISLTSCATTAMHDFAASGPDRQIRNGQLLYRNATTTLIGEVSVELSKATGDFQLSFSKGPGVTLLMIRQDSGFAQVTGALARRGWSGPPDRAPLQLRGWLRLRERFVHADPGQKTIRVDGSGGESWTFRF